MADDKDWVASVVGGTVTRFDKTTTGRSRGTWLVDVDLPDGTTSALVLRRDTGDGPLSGTELSLERESHVYAALTPTAVPIPRLFGQSGDGDALLVERISGTVELNGLDDAGRAAVADSFIESVVELHAVDVEALDLPGFHRPVDAADHALGDLALWRRILEAHVRQPDPVLTYAVAWLGANPPEGPERTVLCHGDLGPGNFLHEEGRVTGLLDWEFAHLGDPMDDLAWLSIRVAQVGGLGDLDFLLDRYHEKSGMDIDADRARYYQLLVLVRMAIACSVALARRGSGSMDASTYFALLPLLRKQMTTLLAAHTGIDLQPPAPPVAGHRSSRADIIETLSNDLGTVLAPELQTEAARSRVMGMALLLSHLSAADELSRGIDDADLDGLEQLLGSRPDSVRAGDAALNAAIAAGRFCPAELIPLVAHRADRQIQMWPILAAFAATPLPEVTAR
ncbi:MAG TPA: phosphotransferase family protein [Acidimicrobiales bacterium]